MLHIYICTESLPLSSYIHMWVIYVYIYIHILLGRPNEIPIAGLLQEGSLLDRGCWRRAPRAGAAAEGACILSP